MSYLGERGPDDEGWYETADVMLGHTRLSIMDVSSAGRGPMSNEDGTVWLTFNGEIYRFWELRTELEHLGHSFRSGSDAEVIIHGYEEWGKDILPRLHGMFALGLWDARTNVLLLARDRLGKKPLFWARKGPTLAFASLMRPLVTCGVATPHIPAAKLREFLFFNYLIGPETIFSGVELLPPGQWLEHRSGTVSQGPYWALSDAHPQPDIEQPQRKFEHMVTEATRARMVSDVPVGVFLSGGVDSALIAALAQKEATDPIQTFSVGFDHASYDERDKARHVASFLGTRHEDVCCRPEDVPDILPRLTASADHLLADQSMIALAKLATHARRSVKVVLTGDGGDELLAGYPTYGALKAASYYVKVLPAQIRRLMPALAQRLPMRARKMSTGMLITRFLNATTNGLAQAHASWRTIWSHDEISDLIGSRAEDQVEWQPYAAQMKTSADWTLLQRAVYADINTWLVDSILSKVDRTTMAVGLEARCPLLDADLMEFAFATLLLDPKNGSKRPLRRLAEVVLPQNVARARKEGFQTPYSAWFAGPLRGYLKNQLHILSDVMPGVFEERVINTIEAEHVNGARDHGLKLWSLVVLAEWSKLFPQLRVVDDA